jgi:hypothetical protein
MASVVAFTVTDARCARAATKGFFSGCPLLACRFVADVTPTVVLDEAFWADLLDSIDAGRVIPVIGEGAVTFGQKDERFAPWLAKKLAASLFPGMEETERELTLNEVVCLWLLKGGPDKTGGPRNTVYTRLNRILREECPEPGPTLKNLAGITKLNLYLTTCFDPLLEKALNEVRFGNQPRTESFSFGELHDLPLRRGELGGATVYHIFGKVSAKPNFAVWEEDMLDFMCELHRLLNISNMKNLACDLKEHSLLVLGLNFSDWLVRFFMRIARQGKLSTSTNVDYLAEGPEEVVPQSMVIFFGGATKNVQVIGRHPSHFCAELAQRWKALYPDQGDGKTHAPVPPPPRMMPTGAIFISYAREDEEVVKQLTRDLERVGCLVWYDRARLKAGMNWHNELEDEVKERCAIFLSIVSRTTESQAESYYHVERNWAANRAERFPNPEEFYIPVVIDDTPIPFQREPRPFRLLQATALPGGALTPEFGGLLLQLQARRRAGMSQP